MTHTCQILAFLQEIKRSVKMSEPQEKRLAELRRDLAVELERQTDLDMRKTYVCSILNALKELRNDTKNVEDKQILEDLLRKFTSVPLDIQLLFADYKENVDGLKPDVPVPESLFAEYSKAIEKGIKGLVINKHNADVMLDALAELHR